MFCRSKVLWSPCETEYLKLHRQDTSVDQLALWLGKSRSAVQKKIAELDGKVTTIHKNSKSFIGKRPDLNNSFFRSAWEANVCRWFNFQGWKWFFEPKAFIFDKFKKGTLSYLPDFYLPEQDIYVEVKGFLTGQGRTALRRFKKFYPEEFKKLRAIPGSRKTKAAKFFEELGVPILASYDELNKQYRNKIPHWE